MTDYSPDSPALERELQAVSRTIGRILEEVGKEVIGQDKLKNRLITALITEGHILLEGVPGLAKTLSIKSLATCIDATFHRIQFTPDLLPADLIGTEIFRMHDSTFEVRRGPVFANFVLADEINRAPAKVQSALLETMQERQVTIGEATLKVPDPFFVMATQNPIEQEGTYPLPEAQIDRFIMKVKVDYPTREEEKRMLDLVTSKDASRPHAAKVATLDDIRHAKRIAQSVYVDDRVRQYIVNLVWASRRPAEFNLNKLRPLIELGASPRAVISLYLASRAEALIAGERYVVPQMIKDVAFDVLRHRIIPTYEAEAQGLTPDNIIQIILDGVEVP